MPKPIQIVSIVAALLGSSAAHAFTIENYRLGMSKKEAAVVGLANCRPNQSTKGWVCAGRSALAGVGNVEVDLAADGRVIGIDYRVVKRDRWSNGELFELLHLSSCPPKDVAPNLTNDRFYELCLGGKDRIRTIGTTSKAERNGRPQSSLTYWVVGASYDPTTNRLQRQELARQRCTKAFNDSLR